MPIFIIRDALSHCTLGKLHSHFIIPTGYTGRFFTKLASRKQNPAQAVRQSFLCHILSVNRLSDSYKKHTMSMIA